MEDAGEAIFSYQHIRVGKPRGQAVPIIIREHLPDFSLKPEQTYDPSTYTIVEIHQDGQ